MKNYYNENYELLLKRSSLYKGLEDEEHEDTQVVVNEDAKGNQIVGIIRDGREWYYGSIYDNQYYINTWYNKLEVKSYDACIFLFGMGDINIILKTVEKYPNNKVILYEPDVAYYKAMLEMYDLRKLISNNNVYLLAGKWGLNGISNLAKEYIYVTNYKYNVCKVQAQYEELYKEEFEEWNGLIEDAVGNVVLDRNTIMKYGQKNLKNVMANYDDCIKSRNILELIDGIKEKMGDTAILVSAGPSLDKNVELLKEAKGKAFLLVVDTALRPVLKRGIRPDLTVTVDAYKPLELFEYDNKVVDIPLVACISANHEVIEKYNGRRFYEYCEDACFGRMYDKDDFKRVALATGGSVANNGFSFLLKAGFKNIIMIGQDLAYPNGKIHAEDTFKDRERIDYKQRVTDFLVEDVYGDKVYTEYNMNQYRKWFESIIQTYPQFNVIDATEGGAKIKGTTVMTLREAIDKYVAPLPEVDYEKVIADVPELEETEKQRRLKIYYGFVDEIKETKSDMDEALGLYEKLEELNEKGQYAGKEFKNLVRDIDKVTGKIKNSVFATLMTRIRDQREYEVLGEIYENKDTVYDEIKLIIESGRKLFDKYFESYDMVKEMMEEAVAKSKKKQ